MTQIDEEALQQAMIASDEASANQVPRILAVRDVVAAYLTALEAKGYVIEQGWQPIETAPKDGAQILVFGHPCDEYGRRYAACAHVAWWGQGSRMDDDRKTWRPQSPADHTLPTHWRPIPQPPLAARGE